MDARRLIGVNACFTSCGLAAGTTTTLTTARDQHYSLKGKGYYKAATSNEASPTTDAVTAAAFNAIKGGGSVANAKGNIGVFVICRDSSGNLKAVQGGIEPLDISDAVVRAPQLPEVPDTLAPIGYLTIKAANAASASGWVFGTNNMSAVSGITYAFQDLVGGMVDRPQSS